MAGIFKAYDIRGIYGKDLTEEVAYKIGRALVTFTGCKKAAVARDIRPHSEPLFAALAKGLTEQGSDVIDLDYRAPCLWKYLIDTLVMWAGIVDGFRCDVASFVPLAFWRRAREAVAEVNPNCIWLAETVHLGYGCLARRNGIDSALDTDMFSVFRALEKAA